MNRKHAFSLVELVIVVVIIGMIAAVAVPRISRGAKGAAESAVKGSLASLRSAIDLYAAEHNGVFPGADGDADTFLDQLTKKTDVHGNVGTTAGTHIYGPYLRAGIPPLPVGPNAGASGVEMVDTGPASDETKTTSGWVYNYTTGDIIANTDDKDEATVAYDTY
jgi:general secretion pathway protein G